MPLPLLASHRPRGIRVVLASMLAVLALLLSGCIPGSSGPRFSSDPAAQDGAPAGLEKFYSQKLNWSDCGALKCAKLTVPLDYAKPSGDTIQLALIDLPAKSQKRGYLVTNPGGPGGSGVDLVRDSGTQQFSATLRSAYDIIGFDPRGVQASAPVTCLTDEQRDQERAENYDLDTAEGFSVGVAEASRDAQLCKKNTGAVLAHVDTVSAVKDMDILRAALGETTLNYLGFSYGTKLGYTYAELFTNRVGRFVLDGAMQPGLSIEDLGMGQAQGFEKALRAFAQSCADKKCDLGSSTDEVMTTIQGLNKAYQTTPQRTSDGRVLTGSGFNSALSLGMYSTSLWEPLRQALSSAHKGSPDAMMSLADYAADRDPTSGKYTTNSSFAFAAINCLDYPTTGDRATLLAESKRLQAASPSFGKYMGYTGVLCSQWPYKPDTKPHAISLSTPTPVVVVGTTGDPATPYQWAQGLHRQLTNSALLTFKGEGHTAYKPANSCVVIIVDRYLVDGTTPNGNPNC